MSFTIDHTLVSEDEILTGLQAFVDSQPDQEKWQVFFTSSSGAFTLKLMSAFGAYLKQNAIITRREAYQRHAKARASIIGGAQGLGYSSFRGKNPRIKLTITPSSTGVWNKWQQIGTAKGFPLYILNETSYNNAVPLTVECTFGELIEETLISDTDRFRKFRFTEKLVSEDIRIYIDSNEIETSSNILDLLEDKFYVTSNPVGSVDAEYLNNDSALYNFNINSEIKLEWIRLNTATVLTTDVTFDDSFGVVTNTEITSLVELPEDDTSIQENAPLQNETRRVIRGRNDYWKVLLLAESSLISAGGKDGATSWTFLVFGVKENLGLLTTIEKNNLGYSISRNRDFGVAPATIIDPEIVFLETLVTIYKQAGTNGNIPESVRNILATFEKRVGRPEEPVVIDYQNVEQQFTDLSFVKISRISTKSVTWLAGQIKRRGYHLSPTVANGFIYEVKGFLRKSGLVEPTWPIALGGTVTDGQVVWEAIAQNNTLPAWTASTSYAVNDSVKHLGVLLNDPALSFKVKKILSKSGTSTPAVSSTVVYSGATFTAITAGINGNSIALVFDGVQTITTVVNSWNSSNSLNQVSFSGLGGGTVLPAGTATLVGGQNAFNAEPLWPTPINITEPEVGQFVDDNQLIWLMVKKEGVVSAWVSNTTYEYGDLVLPTAPTVNQANIMFQMVGRTGKTGSVQPTWPIVFGNSVYDNELILTARTLGNSPENVAEEEYYIIKETITVI